jgi:signal peptidase I
MTLKKCLIYIFIGGLFSIFSIYFYIAKASRLIIAYGIIGYIIAALLFSLSIAISLKTIGQETYIDTEQFKEKRIRSLDWMDWLSFISVSTMGILMVFMFFMIPSDVKQNSMYPTLISGDRVVVYHFMYQPKKNDIAVANMKNYGDNNLYVKRIYGLPHDQVTFVKINDNDYHLFINGVLLESIVGVTYKIDQQGVDRLNIHLDDQGRLMDSYYILLGDNALGSTDSRKLGAIHEKDIIGKIILIFWRFN